MAGDWDIYAGLDQSGGDVECQLQPLASTATAAGWLEVNPVIASKPQLTSAASAVLAFQDAEVKELRARVNHLEQTVSGLQHQLVERDRQVKTLEQERTVLVRNVSTVYRTAVAELERRTAEIQTLRGGFYQQRTQQVHNRSERAEAPAGHLLHCAADARQQQLSGTGATQKPQPCGTGGKDAPHPIAAGGGCSDPAGTQGTQPHRDRGAPGGTVESRQYMRRPEHRASSSRYSADDRSQADMQRRQDPADKSHNSQRPGHTQEPGSRSQDSRLHGKPAGSRQGPPTQSQMHASKGTASTDQALGQKRRLDDKQYSRHSSSQKPLADCTNKHHPDGSASKRARY